MRNLDAVQQLNERTMAQTDKIRDVETHLGDIDEKVSQFKSEITKINQSIFQTRLEYMKLEDFKTMKA